MPHVFEPYANNWIHRIKEGIRNRHYLKLKLEGQSSDRIP